MRRLRGMSNRQGRVCRTGFSLHVSLCDDACAVLAPAFGFEYDGNDPMRTKSRMCFRLFEGKRGRTNRY